jgi:hypothetical protein
VAELDVDIPDGLRGGAYANGIFAWYTAHEFTLDFIAVDSPPGEDSEVLRCTVTSRVRIPVTLIFELIRTLNEEMTRYENAFGEIPPSQRRDSE